MEFIEVTGILIAIAGIIYGAMRGVSILILAPVSAIIVIVSNRMPFFASLVGTENSYMTGLADFVINFFAVFALGAILAKYIETSGAAQAIANKVLEWTGTEKPFAVLVGIFLITAFLTYGGISLFVAIFVLVPLAKPLFKRLNIAWNLVVIPITLGFGTFTMTMLPGTPSIQNVVPTAYLGTTLTAAPVLGIIGSAIAIVFSLVYAFYARTEHRRRKTFADFETENSNEALKDEIPPFFISVLPLAALIAIILAGSLLKVENTILIGLAAAILISAVVFRKYLPSQLKVVNEGVGGSVMPILLTSSSVAFGVVITLAPGFKYISSLILGIPGPPLIGLSVASAAFGGITGSSSGALGIVLQAFGQNYLAMGLNPEVIHRVSAIASSVITVMPHSGVVLTMFSLTGLNHKNAFMEQFIGMTGANLLALMAVIAAALMIY